MRRCCAIGLLAVALAVPVRGDGPPVCRVDRAPGEALELELNGQLGLWLRDDKAKAAAARIEWCEDNLARCSADAQIDKGKVAIPTWVWVTGGILVGGVAGYYMGKALR